MFIRSESIRTDTRGFIIYLSTSSLRYATGINQPIDT